MFPETALGKEPGITGTKPQEGQTERKRIWNQRKGRNEENTEHRREGHEGIRTKAPGQRRRAEGTEKNVTKQRHRQKGTGKKAKEEDIGGWWQVKGTRTRAPEDAGKKAPARRCRKETPGGGYREEVGRLKGTRMRAPEDAGKRAPARRCRKRPPAGEHRKENTRRRRRQAGLNL